MIKRLIALIAIAAGIFSLIWFAPQFTLTIGELPKAEVLKVKAQDLNLVPSTAQSRGFTPYVKLA